MADAPVHHWDRPGAHGPWWIPDESPGKLGDPEIWMDESALDMYGRGDAEPAIAVIPVNRDDFTADEKQHGTWWVGAVIRFGVYPGLGGPCVYKVISRRFGPGNLNRPYYVLRWPD